MNLRFLTYCEVILYRGFGSPASIWQFCSQIRRLRRYIITLHLPPKPFVTTSLFYSSRTAVFLSNFTPEDWYIVSLLIFIRLAYLSVVPHFH